MEGSQTQIISLQRTSLAREVKNVFNLRGVTTRGVQGRK
jgi:hypothetical protein